MEVKIVDKGICAPTGFKAAGRHCGFRKNKTKKDLAVIFSEEPCSAAAVYTQNKVQGACIKVCKDHLKDSRAQAVICNSGIANTCAPNGVEIANETCELLAAELDIKKEDIVVCSTGVIGEELAIEPFKKGIPKIVKKLSSDGNGDAMEAIMTTDTVFKEKAISFMIGNTECTIGAMSKGSGMVNPNMATTLSFITTDVNIAPDLLKKALEEDVVETFNQISIDGDTSTNDQVTILANGMAGNKIISKECNRYKAFCKGLRMVTHEMARKIAKDGEGASKLIQCEVNNAPDKETARKIASSVIQSDLVKSAFAYADPNWGRVICAVGYADGDFTAENVDISLKSEFGEIKVCKASKSHPFAEKQAVKVLEADEVYILVNMHEGKEKAVAYGCDLTTAYVKLNGKYRT